MLKIFEISRNHVLVILKKRSVIPGQKADVEEYSFSSPAASKESLSKEEAAATKQETIIIKTSRI